MASSEEDGTNGASEAGDEKEATRKRRRLGFLATAWLTFYNIAMTAGYVRAKVPPRSARSCAIARRSGLGDAGSARSRGCRGSRRGEGARMGWNGSARGEKHCGVEAEARGGGLWSDSVRVGWLGGRGAEGAHGARAQVHDPEHSGRASGALRARARMPGPWGVSARRGRAGRWGRGAAGLNGAGRGGRPRLAGHCLIRCTAWRGGAGRGPEVKYRPGQECGADPRGRRLWPDRPCRLPLLLKKSWDLFTPAGSCPRPVHTGPQACGSWCCSRGAVSSPTISL